MKGIEEMKEDVALAVLPDHPTPCRTRTHSREAVPFVMWHRGCIPILSGNTLRELVRVAAWGICPEPDLSRSFWKCTPRSR